MNENENIDPGFALDAESNVDVTPGRQYARAVKSGEIEPFDARLGVEYVAEESAYLVSVEDIEGNVNSLYVEASAFLAMCERVAGPGVADAASGEGERDTYGAIIAAFPDAGFRNEYPGYLAATTSTGEVVISDESFEGDVLVNYYPGTDYSEGNMERIDSTTVADPADVPAVVAAVRRALAL